MPAAQHAVADGVDKIAPLLERAAGQASAITQRGIDAVLAGSQTLRSQAQRASDSTVHYIREEPVKAVLIAAATGAALVALASLLTRSRNRV
jgi:ElaB/YqjD/DUF883 family membrane-anchored ribosome-binding protein